MRLSEKTTLRVGPCVCVNRSSKDVKGSEVYGVVAVSYQKGVESYGVEFRCKTKKFLRKV